jgi:photosystem II stability/assembly factor-like uncharacterized protein
MRFSIAVRVSAARRALVPVLAVMAASVLSHRATAQAHDSVPDNPTAREEWFWAQRTYPFSERPYRAMMQARLAVMNSAAFARSALAAPLQGAWRAVGPTGMFVADGGFFASSPQLDAGRVAAIVPGAQPGQPLLIGTASGGVWRSLDVGLTWTPVTDGQCALTIGAMALDPTNPSIVYAGTGEGNTGTPGCGGVLRSTDAGVTWAALGTSLVSTAGAPTAFSALVVDRVSTSVLLAGVFFSNAGVVRSTNGGVTWSVALASGPVSSIVAHPTQTGTYFAGDRAVSDATGATRGVYKSIDAGATWTQLTALPVSSPVNIGRVELAVSAADPNKVWAIVNDRSNGRFGGLFVWDDVAKTWATLPAAGLITGDRRGDFGGQTSYDLAVAVDPRTSNRIYVAGVRAFRSTDGGATFTPMGMEIHCDWHSIVLDPRNPDILYAGTDGGIFISTDGGDTWTSRNEGLAITQFYPGIGANPGTTILMGGSQDNGTLRFTGSPFWDGFLSGDGGYTAINYQNPVIQYGETQWSTATGGTIVRRDATSFKSRVSGIVVGDRVAFIPPLILDPITPTKLYFGTFRLYRTVDEGASWLPVSPDLSKGSGVITTIAVAKSDSNTIYVGTSDGNVHVSVDGAVTFTPRITGLPNRSITRIVVDPAAATHALVTVSGYGTGHVFETSDGGATWRDISGNLVNAPANASVFVGATGNIFVGTDVGVFQTSDDGQTWVAGPSGMPNVIIHDLIYDPSANTLIAATYGRGMFTYAVGGVSPVLRGDVNGDGKVDALDALLIQQALVSTGSITTSIFPRGDANCNGVIDSGDVVAVLRAAVGLPAGSCVGVVR